METIITIKPNDEGEWDVHISEPGRPGQEETFRTVEETVKWCKEHYPNVSKAQLRLF